MQWHILITPIMGACIGYITNKIAVQMLFKPLEPKYIMKFHIPFTPGIIPKEKGRLAKTIGNAVGDNLLAGDSIKQTLLSPKVKKEITVKIEDFISESKLDDTSIKTKLTENIDSNFISEIENDVKKIIISRVTHGLIQMNIGKIMADEILSAIEEKLHGTMLTMMLNTNLITQVVDEIQTRVNLYVENHGEGKVEEFVEKELNNIMQEPVSVFAQALDKYDYVDMILQLYKAFVDKYADQIIDTIELSRIAEEKINTMDILEVEKLVLSIMEKELGAVVNLGALIGFILGLVNILF